MADYETLRWEQDSDVVTITLDRPQKKNAMSWTMFQEIGDAFRRAGEADDVRCVVITGAGDAFCSGADLTDPVNAVSSAFEMRDRMSAINSVVLAVANCPKPTIARVTGVAAGAGCNLALLCDFIVASTDAKFAELFVKRGLVVDFGGTWALTRLLPLHRAKELAMLGDTISGDQANQFGLVSRLCHPDEIDAVVKDLAQRLAAQPPRTLTLIKENLNRAAERSLAETLEAETVSQSLSITSNDTREAILAWVEKREPRFTGR